MLRSWIRQWTEKIFIIWLFNNEEVVHSSLCTLEWLESNLNCICTEENKLGSIVTSFNTANTGKRETLTSEFCLHHLCNVHDFRKGNGMHCFCRVTSGSWISRKRKCRWFENGWQNTTRKILLFNGWDAYPSTQGSGCKVSRFIPITLMIVLIADTPSHPDLRATRAGCKREKQKTNFLLKIWSITKKI